MNLRTTTVVQIFMWMDSIIAMPDAPTWYIVGFMDSFIEMVANWRLYVDGTLILVTPEK
jgi:hypothetical protein